MKVHIQLTTALIIGMSALILGGLVVILPARYSAYRAREILPPIPAVDSVSFTAITSTGSSLVKARHFRFATKRPSDSKAIETVTERFETQLVAGGWEKLAATNTGNLFISTWQHKNKMGGLRLVFSIIQLDPRGEYFGTMVPSHIGLIHRRQKVRRMERPDLMEANVADVAVIVQ